MTDTKVDAWMPLWIGAYLADTMTLSRDSHGGYLLLLFAYWRNKGPLADDDEELAAITKATPSEWKKLRPRLAKFFTVEAGLWLHGRADKELTAAGLRKAGAVAKAKAGADALWAKRRAEAAASEAGAMPQACSEHAPSIAQAMPEQCPTPSPITSPPSVKKLRQAAPCPEDVDAGVWRDWTALRLGHKAQVSDTAVTAARSEAAKAGMSFEAFLTVWCLRGTRGLQADWIKPHERSAGPTFRERDAANAAARVHEMTGGLVAAKPVPITRRNDVLQEVFDATPRLVG